MKAILFDFDGVLTVDKYGSDSILRYLAENTNVPMDVLKREYYKINKGLLYGEYTHEDVWEDFCGGIGVEIGYRVLVDAFRATPIDMGMIAIVRELKMRYKIGMITDNKIDRMETILAHFDLNGLFDTVVVSAECKCGKSDRRIFEIALQKIGERPEECVFVDNSENNLIVPAQMGIKTILFDDEKRDLDEFRCTLGVFLEGSI